MADELTDALAEHAAQRQLSEIPEHAIAATRRLFLDTLAVGWAGAGNDGLPQLRAGMLPPAGGVCDLWGVGQRAAPLDAAFLNSASAAALEYDSLHEAGLIHSDLICVPAVLAVAQAAHASGRDFLAALVLGNDVACRLAMAARTHTGWWHSSVYGVFGAAAGCARLLRLDTAGVRSAMGIALSQAGGTQQAILEQSAMKRMQSAVAARAGVFSAQLASWGVAGPAEPLLGSCGLFALYEKGDASIALDGLGVRYEGELSSFKKFPTCGCGHAAIESALQLVAQGVQASGIERVTVHLSPYMNRIVGMPYEPGGNPQVAAQFSVRYGIACALLRGGVGLAEIDPAVAIDPQLVEFAQRVKVEIDESSEGRLAPAGVSIVMKDGSVHRHDVTDVPGTAGNPLSAQDLSRKVRDCLARGSAPMTAQAADALAARIDGLQDCPDMADLLAA